MCEGKGANRENASRAARCVKTAHFLSIHRFPSTPHQYQQRTNTKMVDGRRKMKRNIFVYVSELFLLFGMFCFSFRNVNRSPFSHKTKLQCSVFLNGLSSTTKQITHDWIDCNSICTTNQLFANSARLNEFFGPKLIFLSFIPVQCVCQPNFCH